MKKFKKPVQFLKFSLDENSENTRVLKEAENILRHQFFILGKSIKFGKKINWHANFAGKSWPKEPYAEFRSNNYDFENPKKYIGDIKLPWELNKHLYFQDLAKAYLISKDEKYAQEFVAEIEDWLANNPYEIGVNWTEGLVASHRVISWIIGLAAFIKSNKINQSFIKKISSSIYQHALFIEKTYEFCGRASNHLIGELCTQILLSIIFPEFKGSKQRLKNAINHLKRELELQVYDDGVDYEMSLSYQRIILEFLYLPLILQKRRLIELPRKIAKAAEKMTEFMMHMTQPNGMHQPISDADGARVFVLGNDINDFRPHLALSAWLFNRPDFKYVSENKIEQIAWFLSKDELSQLDKMREETPKETSMAFKEGGYWISRQNWSKDSSWLFFDCGYMGMGEWNKEIPVGVHGHSDILNFGLTIGKETFLTDNGSYSYTTERPFHQYFRSSIAHNVVLVDGQDQNIIDPKPWLAYQQALPQNPEHYFTNEIDYIAGEHTGFLRLPGEIVHRREVMHFKNKDLIILKDSFLGNGRHKISENFHLSPGLKIKKENGGFTIRGNKNLNLKSLSKTHASIIIGKTKPVEGWYSPTFGQKIAAPMLKFDFEIDCPSSHYFLLSWGENKQVSESAVKLFEESYAKLRKPRVLILVTNDLPSDSRVRKEALLISQAGFEVKILAFSLLSSEHTFSSKNYEVCYFAYTPFAPWENLKHWLGRKIMGIYFKNKYFSLIISPMGNIRRYSRSLTLSMIDNDINQPIDIIPSKIEPPKKVSLKTQSLSGKIHYWFYVNRKYLQKSLDWHPDEIHVYGFGSLAAGYFAKKKLKVKMIYTPSTGERGKFKKFLANYLADEIKNR